MILKRILFLVMLTAFFNAGEYFLNVCCSHSYKTKKDANSRSSFLLSNIVKLENYIMYEYCSKHYLLYEISLNCSQEGKLVQFNWAKLYTVQYIVLLFLKYFESIVSNKLQNISLFFNIMLVIMFMINLSM